ncbi:MAG: hypothetical protein GYA17_00285 [Chloroflexi bacterium]|nr:hypothetical protein [Chloroflexota bacterium]
MELNLVKQIPLKRCYHCGSHEITSYCHHCGKPMCAKHSQNRQAHSWFTENRELDGINYGSWPFRSSYGAHCEKCYHSNLNYKRILIIPGVIVALIGILLFFLSADQMGVCLSNLPPSYQSGQPSISESIRDPEIYAGVKAGLCYRPAVAQGLLPVFQWIILSVVGIAAIILGYRLIQERKRTDSEGEAARPVYLGPITNKIDLIETLYGTFRIDFNRNASASLRQPVSGKIIPGLQFTSQDLQRIEQYRSKYNNLPSDHNIRYSAGYLDIEKPVNRVIFNQSASDKQFPSLIHMKGKVNQHNYLNKSKGLASSLATDPIEYPVSLDFPELHEKWQDVPVRVIPLLNQSGNSRKVSLEIQINPQFFPYLEKIRPPKNNQPIKLMKNQIISFQKITVRGDIELLGQPQTNGLVRDINNHETFQVEWHQLWAPATDQLIVFQTPEILFTVPIHPKARLSGNIQIQVPALMSGIRRVRYISSLGFPVLKRGTLGKEIESNGVTTLDIDFDVALNQLPVSQHAVYLNKLPDPGKEDFAVQGIPTPEKVMRFLTELYKSPQTVGDSYTYLRSMIQDPKRVTENPGAENMWYWDITGRSFEDVTPTDFHIAIYGGSIEDVNCHTHVEISVKAETYDDNSNKVFQKTIDTIEYTAKNILSQG